MAKRKELYLPLTIPEYAAERNLPAAYLKEVWDLKEVVREGVVCIEQPYTRLDQLGAEIHCDPRWRFGNGSWPGKKSPFDANLTLYGQKQFQQPTFDSECPLDCFLVEGESDTQTLRYGRYNVLGIPGTQSWNECLKNDPDVLPFLKRHKIIVIQEPPSAAEKKKRTDTPARMVAAIRASLPETSVLAVKLWKSAPKNADDEPEYKDISGMWMFYRDMPGRFHQALYKAIARAAAEEKIPQRKLELHSLADEEMNYDEWLWEGRITLDSLTVISGMAERGKSTLAADIAARVTTGSDWPDGAKNTVGACDVLMLAAEEDYGKDIKPRMVAAGADVSRVYFIKQSEEDDGEISLDRDLEQLEAALLKKPALRFIVIDPITSYVGNVDPNKPPEVRPFLRKLFLFASKMNVSILLIMHFSKNLDVAALHRSGGAATWTDYPRAVFLLDKKKDDEGNYTETHVMVPGKQNKVAADKKKTLEYTIIGKMLTIKDKEVSVGTILWGDATDLKMEEQFSNKVSAGVGSPKLDAAEKWLKEILANGDRQSEDIFTEGHDLGHSKDTLYRAKKSLRIVAERSGKSYVWSLRAVTTDA